MTTSVKGETQKITQKSHVVKILQNTISEQNLIHYVINTLKNRFEYRDVLLIAHNLIFLRIFIKQIW